MRLTAYIFAVTMLVLLIQPVILRCEVPLMAKKMSCCEEKSCDQPTEKSKERKDCDKTNSCNPFAGCSQSLYSSVSRFFYQEHFPVDKPAVKPSLESSIQPGFINNCWHPPELTVV